MGLISVSGAPGSRHQEAARLIAQRLGFELVSETRLWSLIEEEFGPNAQLPEKALPEVVTSIIARMATQRHLVVSAEGAELLFREFPGRLRVQVVAPEWFDLVCNTELLEPEQVAEVVAAAASTRALTEQGLLSAAAEAHLQFQVRLKLSRYGIAPPGKVNWKPRTFSHPSEEIFANLLDFYRVDWEYEPRSFPIQWDKEGRVLEAFTPDFYLPQFDLYVELTTMKQSLVTKKNRKIKLLRQIYPQINIQVFYQRDFENLIFKYGLSEPARPSRATPQPSAPPASESSVRGER